MKVAELKKILDSFPEDMDVCVDMHSDFVPVDSCNVIKVVDNTSWYMRTHHSMSEANKARERDVLWIG
jgi:hypothetical protein